MSNSLLKVTATKKSIIISIIIAAFTLLILSFFFVLAIKRYIKPEANMEILYPYGYGLYARNFAIILGIIILCLLLIWFVVLRKHNFNFKFTKGMFVPVLLFSAFGFLIVSIKESRSIASYTNDINHYEKYDSKVVKHIDLISNYLPKKDTVKKYEYFFHRASSMFGSRNMFTMYIQTQYDNVIYQDIINDKKMEKFNDWNNPKLSDCEVYRILVNHSHLNSETIIDYLFILFNKTENKIIYAISNENVDITREFDNYFYIGAFINEDRTQPFFTYPAPEAEKK